MAPVKSFIFLTLCAEVIFRKRTFKKKQTMKKFILFNFKKYLCSDKYPIVEG